MNLMKIALNPWKAKGEELAIFLLRNQYGLQESFANVARSRLA